MGPHPWMSPRLPALTTMSWPWLYRSRTWKWFEKIKKKKNLQERKTHENVQWTHLIISNLVVPHLCGDIGGDILGRLWAADVSNAPF